MLKIKWSGVKDSVVDPVAWLILPPSCLQNPMQKRRDAVSLQNKD
jgi:hypothetical protein